MWSMNWPNFFTRYLYCRYKAPLQFSWFLADIKVLKTAHEFHDFEPSCEKHIIALASAETGTSLCSSSGPSGPRTRMFWPLSGPSGPRVAVPFVLGPFGPSAPLPPFGWQHCRGRLPAPWYLIGGKDSGGNVTSWSPWGHIFNRETNWPARFYPESFEQLKFFQIFPLIFH